MVRQDGEDLSREQAWAIAEYIQFKLSDLLEEALYSGEVKQRRAIITKFVNWKRFDYFLEKFKVEMTGADGKSWANVRSPFGTGDASNGLIM